MVKAAPTDLPQMTENPETPVFYTISNTRSTSGKYLYYAGDELGLKDSNTKSVASLFYFTGTTDEMYVHNAATTKKLASVTSWTEEGTAWAINVTPYGDGTTGLSIGPWDDPFGGACWNEFTHNDCYTTWQANDAGSIFTVEIVEDFSIFLTDAKAAAVAELENLQTVSEIYPDATEAIAAVGAVTVESATISAIEAAIATVNQCVADYKATALQALGGKYFAINTPARDNGFMKVAGTQVSGAADASSSAAVWQFECADGVVKVFNPYTGKYLCEPGNNSTIVAVTENVAAAGAYQLVVYADAENDEAKVKLTSNGKSIHMDAAGVLVRWDNGGASEWTVSEIAVDVTAEITALLDANAENHAETPALGQYSTAGYTALQDAQNTVTTLRQVADAVAAFEAAKCLPVFTIDGVWGYALGMSVYESEEGSLLWRETEHTESMLWTFDMTDTIVGVTDKVVVKNLATGNLFWGASFIQVTETSEAVADDGLFLFYTEGTGAPVHAAQAGQTIVRWNNLSAASASAWKFTFAGTTYSINDLPEVPDTPVVPDTPEGVVNDLASADPTKCYTISTNGRGAWAVDTDGTRFSTTGVEELDVDAADARQQFAILSANGEDYYLYSVSAKKFVKQDRSLVVGAGDAIEFVDASSFEEGRVMVRFRDIVSSNINIGGDNQMVINSWSTIDAGNAVLIAEAGDFDATEALAQLADPEAAELNALIAQVEALVEANAANHAVEPALGQYSTAAYEALAAAVGADSVSKASLEAAIAAFEAAKCLPVFTIDGVYDYVDGKSIYENRGVLYWKATDRTDRTMLWTFDMTNTVVDVTDRVVVKNLATGNYFDNAFFVQIAPTQDSIAVDGVYLIHPEGMGLPLYALSDGRVNRVNSWSANSPSGWKFTYVGTTYGANTPYRDALDVLLNRAKGYNPYSGSELGYYVEDFSYLLDAIAEAEALLLGEPSEAECEAMVAELSQAVEQFESSDKTFRLPEPGKAYRIVSAFSAFYELQSVEKAITINASDNTLWWGDVCPDSLQQEFVFEPVLGDSGVHLSWNMDINISNGTTVTETQYFYNLKHVATGLYASYNDSAKFHLDEQPCTVYLTCLGVGQFGLRFRVENEYGGGTIHCVHAGDHNNGVPSTNQGNYGGIAGISSGIVSWYGGFDTASAWYIRECPARPDTPVVPDTTVTEAYNWAGIYTVRAEEFEVLSDDFIGYQQFAMEVVYYQETDRYVITEIVGYGVIEPNDDGGIQLTPSTDDPSKAVIDPGEGAYLTFYREDRGCLRLTDTNLTNAPLTITRLEDGTFTISDFCVSNVIHGTDSTGAVETPAAYYRDVTAVEYTKYAIMPINYYSGLSGWITGATMYDEDNRIVGYTSPLYRFEDKVETFRMTVNWNGRGDKYFCLSELEFYDSDGNRIELTEENVTSNADHNTLNPNHLDGGGIPALFDGSTQTYFHSAWDNMPAGDHYLQITLPDGGYDAFSFRMLSRAYSVENGNIIGQEQTFPAVMVIDIADTPHRDALEVLLNRAKGYNPYSGSELGYYVEDFSYLLDAIAEAEALLLGEPSEAECEAMVAELSQAVEQFESSDKTFRLPEPGKAYRIVSALPAFYELQSVEKAITINASDNTLWWGDLCPDSLQQEFVFEPVLGDSGVHLSWNMDINLGNGTTVSETQYFYNLKNVATGLYASYNDSAKFHLDEQPCTVYLTCLGIGQFGLKFRVENEYGGGNIYTVHAGDHNEGVPSDSIGDYGGVFGISSGIVSWYGGLDTPSAWYIREYPVQTDTVPSLQLVGVTPDSETSEAWVSALTLSFNKEIAVWGLDGFLRGINTGEEFYIISHRISENSDGGFDLTLYFEDADDAWSDIITVPDTYTYTIPAGAIKSVDGEVFPETTFTFTVDGTFSVVSYSPAETTSLEQIELTFDRVIEDITIYYGWYVYNEEGDAVAYIDWGSGHGSKTVTLGLNEPITTPGKYYLHIFADAFTAEGYMPNMPTDIMFTVVEDTQNTAKPGDVNGDGNFTMIDVVMTVNAVLEKEQTGFNANAADLNGDGQITMVDVVGVLQLVLTDSSSKAPVHRDSNRTVSMPVLNACELEFMGNGGVVLPVALCNGENYSAFQLDVQLPAGVELTDVELAGRAKASHTMAWNTLSDGTIRVVAYAMDNASFNNDGGTLLNLVLNTSNELSADAEVVLTDGLFASVDGLENRAPAVNVLMRSDATYVDGTVAGTFRVYGTEGAVVVECGTDTAVSIYAATGRLVRQATVEAGKSTIILPSGVYVVNGNKVIVK